MIENLNELIVLKSKIQSDLDRLESELGDLIDSNFLKNTQKWEYLVEEDILPERMAILGLQGYEMVGCLSYSVGGGFTFNGTGSQNYTIHLQYVFKRKIILDTNEISEAKTLISEKNIEYEKVSKKIEFHQEIIAKMDAKNALEKSKIRTYKDGSVQMIGNSSSYDWRYRKNSEGLIEVINPMGGVSLCQDFNQARSIYTWCENFPDK